MDRIQELLTRLADLSDAEIAELEGLILAEFDSVEAEEPTNDSVERMVALADALDSVRSEVGRRNTQADDLAKKASEASSRVHTGFSEESSSLASKKDDEEDMPPEPMPEDAVEPGTEPMPEPDVPPMEPPAPPTVAEPGADVIAEDIAKVTEDVADVVDDAEAVGEEVGAGEASPEDEEEKKKKMQYSSSPAPGSQPGVTELSSDSEQESPTPTHEQVEQENAMTASSNIGDGVVVTPPADAAPVVNTSRGLTFTITASGEVPGYAIGQTLPDMDEVARATARKLHTLRNVQGAGEQFHVATLSYNFPEERKLHGDDADNYGKISKVVSPQAITAAAGVCAPLETLYDITICGDADRPIRDMLPRFNADRGGIRMFAAPTMQDCAGTWNVAYQCTPHQTGFGTPTVTGPGGFIPGTTATGSTAAGAAGIKSCCEAHCPVPEDIVLGAVYACMTFSNFTNRFFPEVIKANTDLAMISHARWAELKLINDIYQKSTTFDAKNSATTPGLGDGDIGVTRNFVRQLHNAAAHLRRKLRLRNNSPMRAILPNWVLDAMIADLAQQMPGDGLEVLSLSSSRIEQLFRERGINVTWSLDNWTATAAAAGDPGASQGFDATISFPLFPEGTFLFLDGGTLDLGVQRDMTMIGRNEYATFMETFEGLAKTGCESLWVTMDACSNGTAAALVANACA